MASAYLSLGANLGDREAHIREALRRLDIGGVRVMRVSPLYETAPRDVKDQPWFLNLAAEIETELVPRELLSEALSVELYMGRRRTVPKGPRAIDIDILFYGDQIIDEPGLHIPHPRLQDRRFVLAPLADLVPDLIHPVLKRTVRELLGATLDQDVRRL